MLCAVIPVMAYLLQDGHLPSPAEGQNKPQISSEELVPSSSLEDATHPNLPGLHMLEPTKCKKASLLLPHD